MTLFDTLFQHPAVRQRHHSAPLCKERLAYLSYAKGLGRQECTVKLMASYLLHVNRALGFSNGMRPVTVDELKKAGRTWEAYSGPQRTKLPGKTTYRRFMEIARAWLRFHSCLIERVKTQFADEQLRDYECWLKHQRGLAASTVKERSKHALYFLKWLAKCGVALRAVNCAYVQHYLEAKEAAGWALSTRITAASALRVFLKHSEERGSVRAGVCETVPYLRRAKQTFEQRGPSWRDVRRMISSLNGLTAIDLRDRPMILLMALYGLRAGEIRALRIGDADLANRILTVVREKNHDIQRFPLSSEVSSAIQRYLKRGRPVSPWPSLFLTTQRPYRPISASQLYCRVNDLFRRSGVESRERGPHALRHACANQLLDTGVAVRDIGLFLGHRTLASVREYARYSLSHLRQIAEFSLEGLL